MSSKDIRRVRAGTVMTAPSSGGAMGTEARIRRPHRPGASGRISAVTVNPGGPAVGTGAR
jgi:hypothetical protein